MYTLTGFETRIHTDAAVSLLFSGEEAYGRYLDLYANHSTYNNLRDLPKHLPYLQYLDILLAAQDGPVHRDLPQKTRFTKEFEAYVHMFSFCLPACANSIKK